MKELQDLRARDWGLSNLSSPSFFSLLLLSVLFWVLTSFSPNVHSAVAGPLMWREQYQVKERVLIFTCSNIDFSKWFSPYLGGASILWTYHFYQRQSLLILAISRPFVHLGSLDDGGMSRTYDLKRGVRKAYWEEQK